MTTALIRLGPVIRRNPLTHYHRPQVQIVNQLFQTPPRFEVKKSSAKAGTSTKIKNHEVEKDPEILVTHCCGLNYNLEGEHVKLKDDSEYPDWLFEMDIKRPKPPCDEMEPGTMEYYLELEKETQKRKLRLSKLKKKLHIYSKSY